MAEDCDVDAGSGSGMADDSPARSEGSRRDEWLYVPLAAETDAPEEPPCPRGAMPDDAPSEGDGGRADDASAEGTRMRDGLGDDTVPSHQRATFTLQSVGYVPPFP